MRCIAYVAVEPRFLDFVGLVFIVPVFDCVIFEAVQMRVVSSYLREIGVSWATKRLWKNETERDSTSGGHAFRLVNCGGGEGRWEGIRGKAGQEAVCVRDCWQRGGEGGELPESLADFLGKFPGKERSGTV